MNFRRKRQQDNKQSRRERLEEEMLQLMDIFIDLDMTEKEKNKAVSKFFYPAWVKATRNDYRRQHIKGQLKGQLGDSIKWYIEDLRAKQ